MWDIKVHIKGAKNGQRTELDSWSTEWSLTDEKVNRRNTLQ